MSAVTIARLSRKGGTEVLVGVFVAIDKTGTPVPSANFLLRAQSVKMMYARREAIARRNKEKQMKKALVVGLFVLMEGISVMAQGTVGTLTISNEYPLQAQVISTEMQTASFTTSQYSYTDYQGKVQHGGGAGGSYNYQLMNTVVGDKLYGLAGYARRESKRRALEMGVYPAKKVKNGFEIQYTDEKGKIQHETLYIQRTAPAPEQQK